MPSSMTTLTPGGMSAAQKMAGVTQPFGFFDPLGCITADSTVEEVMLYREAELAHGRVAMMGALGYLVQSKYRPHLRHAGRSRDPPPRPRPLDGERPARR